jgi:hypothetical protein
LISWTDYSRCALTLRVALAGDRRRRGVVEPSFCLSAVRIIADESRNAVGLNWDFFENWLPGTDSNRRPTD